MTDTYMIYQERRIKQEGKENRTGRVHFHVPPIDISDQLARANELLLARRKANQDSREAVLPRVEPSSRDKLAYANAELQKRRSASSSKPHATLQTIPSTHAQPFQFDQRSEVERAGFARSSADLLNHVSHLTPSKPDEPEVKPALVGTVKIYPCLANALHKHDKTILGRIWLILRHLDGECRGWVDFAWAKEQCTTPNSLYYIYGERRWRDLLKEGEGLFWQRDKKKKERLWLTGTAILGQRLDVQHFADHPVALPIAKIVEGLHQFRAHLYAAFHAGRASTPISRKTLYDITGVPQGTLWSYEETTGIKRRGNIAIGKSLKQVTEIEREQFFSEYLFVGFVLTDYLGVHGAKGERYLAWRLPNSYQSDLLQLPKGRQKKINRYFNSSSGLVNIRGRGNTWVKIRRVFCQTAQDAKGNSADNRYLPINSTKKKGGDGCWRVLSRDPNLFPSFVRAKW